MSRSTGVSSKLSIPNLTGALLSYQEAGVEYAAAHQRTFIADEMGLGKTIKQSPHLNTFQIPSRQSSFAHPTWCSTGKPNTKSGRQHARWSRLQIVLTFLTKNTTFSSSATATSQPGHRTSSNTGHMCSMKVITRRHQQRSARKPRSRWQNHALQTGLYCASPGHR